MQATFYRRYQNRKNTFLNDPTICQDNRALFRRFLDWEERKLIRTNGLSELDEGCCKTLLGYILRISNTNRWFENKPLKQITAADIRRVYDALEDGRIVRRDGKRVRGRKDYYNKIFKSKLFAMVGKDTVAEKVIEFYTPEKPPVRFVREVGVRKINEYTTQLNHKALVWLGFDIGENVGSLLQVVKEDCVRELSPSNEPEYRIILRPEILKRSRTPRSLLTNYPETVQILDELLGGLAPGERLFSFGHRAAEQFLSRAARDANVRCEPTGDSVTWKDLRSGMACDLLLKRWPRDLIIARLGHKPSSREIDKYVNHLALDGREGKAKIQQFEKFRFQEIVDQNRAQQKVSDQEMQLLREQVQQLHAQMKAMLEARNPSLADIERAIAIKKGLAGSGLELNDVQ